jgi:nicotinate-nucleotide adenylyltransferase
VSDAPGRAGGAGIGQVAGRTETAGTQSTAGTESTAGALGILGGTFDPIHLGHLAIAEQARDVLALDRVLFVPAARPPHKLDRRISPAADREAMVALAIADNPAFELSRLELERPGPSYAVDTVAEVAARSHAEGRGDPVFILSVEALAAFPTWRSPGRILESCRLAVAPRPGAAAPSPEWLAEHFPGQVDRFIFLPGPCLPHAATDIRDLVANGRSIRYLVPAAVERYIVEHALYRDRGSDGRQTVGRDRTRPYDGAKETSERG